MRDGRRELSGLILSMTRTGKRDCCTNSTSITQRKMNFYPFGIWFLEMESHSVAQASLESSCLSHNCRGSYLWLIFHSEVGWGYLLTPMIYIFNFYTSVHILKEMAPLFPSTPFTPTLDQYWQHPEAPGRDAKAWVTVTFPYGSAMWTAIIAKEIQ